MTPTANPLIGRRFSRAALTYESAAWHQDRAAETLSRMAPPDMQPRHILEWGCGTGLLTRRLIRRWPAATITALDLAPGMLSEARRQLGEGANVRWVEADAEHYRPPSSAELLMSNCAVQWFAQRAQLGACAAASVRSGGWIALSIPVQGTLGELWQAFADAGIAPGDALPLWDAEACRRTFTRPEWTNLSVRLDTFVARLRNARDVLQTLRRIGATARVREHDAPPLPPASLRRIMQAYDARFRQPDTTVPCTYRIAFVSARRT